MTRPPDTAPIAIIGLGCLFPRAADAARYWANILAKVDAISEVPPSHWNPDDYFDADPKKPDHTYARRGGFLSPVEFPALDFGITPNALEATDTTQLLGLLAARQALEDAGYGPGKSFDRSRVSVILGVTGTLELVVPLGARLGHPLWRRALKAAGVADDVADDVVARIADGYVDWQEDSFPGLLGNVVAGRIANRLDLGGTNCVVDAACASSLSAVHLAIYELTSGRADMVLTGGMDTFNDIFMYMCFSKTPALSPTGNAKPFDAAGDGTILGEGLGCLVLKRLADAERDGDRIYAVIKSVGTSSDGKGHAIYAPSPAGQARALRQAYQLADVSPDTVELVEAHGTGTKAGDAAEVKALQDVYRSARAEGSWCALGSVKSQIGHTKAAAGAAGLIKAALALHHKVLPPTIKVQQPIEALTPGQSPFYVNTEARPWLPHEEHPRRAAVSSFGFGGSNFHCVLEEYTPQKTATTWDDSVQIVPLSADSRSELSRQLDEWQPDLAKFDHRQEHRLTFVVQRDRTDQRKQLEAARTLLSRGPGYAPEGVSYGVGPTPKLALLFPGQGAQYPGMLRDLVCQFPAAFETFHQSGTTRLVDVVYPPAAFSPEEKARQEAALRATDVAQPALGAVSLAAWRVVESFGLRADAAAGHSYGELVALCAAGRLTPDDLHRLSRERGRLMAATSPGAGAMLAVLAPVATIQQVLVEERLDLVLANRNAPAQTVLSGPVAEIDLAATAFAARKIRATRLTVSAAFHSPLVADAETPFRTALGSVALLPGRIPVFANTTAQPYPDDAEAARDLLAGQLTRPVEWAATILNLYAAGVHTFVEVGPGARLTGLVAATLEGQPHEAIALDASNGARSGSFDLALLLARLAALGQPVRLADWNPARPKPPTGSGFSVTLTGANYVKPRPVARPAPARIETHSERNGMSTAPMNNGKKTPSPTSTPVNGVPAPPPNRLPPPAPTASSNALTQALQVSRESMAALQRLHEQTAQLHRQFLEGQENAQRTLQMLIEQQQSLLLASLGSAPANLAPVVAPPPPVKPAPEVLRTEHLLPDPQHAVTPEPPPLAPEPPPPAPPETDRIAGILVEVVAEKTGYPAEMLDLDMALDADLGIDSIKRVEILSSLQERLPDAPVVKPEHLGTLLTLRHIATFLSGSSAKKTDSPARAVAPTRSPVSTLERSTVRLVPLGPRRALPVPRQAEFWVTSDDAALAAALERELQGRGCLVRLLPCAAVATQRIDTLAGLVVVAPPTPTDDFLRDALFALQRVAPALRRQGDAVFATVTQLGGGFGFDGIHGDPSAGGLAGLVKTAGREWPELACKALDVNAAQLDAAAVVEELFLAGPTEVGLNGGQRFGLELSRAPSPAPVGDPLRPGDVVVVSGGARGVTAETALALAQAFRPTLVLLGRAPQPSPEPSWLQGLTAEADLKRELAARSPQAGPKEIGEHCRQLLANREIVRNLARLEAAGSKAIYQSVDVRDAAAVARVLERVRREVGPIRGVVHGAGVLADSRIEDKTPEQFDRVYGTKVDGLRALLSATGGDDLRVLVLFSSTTGRLGRVGQVDYAVANEVLNKMAQRERQRRPNCKVLALNWGPWDGGMVTPALARVFEAEGVGLIPLSAGAEFLVEELRGPTTGPVEIVVLAAGTKVSQPAPELPLAFERTLDPVDHPVLAAHVLDGRPVLPAALILEWLAHGALHANPGLLFHGCDDLRILQGVILPEGHAPSLRVSAGKAAKRDGLFVVPVELRGVRTDGREVAHARADILLVAELPGAPAPRLPIPERPYPHSVETAYGDFLFHGPELQGIERIEGCGADGITATVRTAPAPASWVRQPLRQKWLGDPLVLDGAFQLLILWSFEQRGVGSLPCVLGRYRQYRRAFPAGQVRVVARVTRATEQLATADLEFLDGDNRVIARLDDYECVLDHNLTRAFRRNRLASAVTS